MSSSCLQWRKCQEKYLLCLKKVMKMFGSHQVVFKLSPSCYHVVSVALSEFSSFPVTVRLFPTFGGWLGNGHFSVNPLGLHEVLGVYLPHPFCGVVCVEGGMLFVVKKSHCFVLLLCCGSLLAHHSKRSNRRVLLQRTAPFVRSGM